jgi:hypothetical protein
MIDHIWLRDKDTLIHSEGVAEGVSAIRIFIDDMVVLLKPLDEMATDEAA